MKRDRKKSCKRFSAQSSRGRHNTHCLNKNNTVESVQGLPSPRYAQHYVCSVSVKKGGIEVGLDVNWSNGRDSHERRKQGVGRLGSRRRNPCLLPYKAVPGAYFRVAAASPRTATMSYTQPHPRQSILSNSSHSSVEHFSPTASSTRFSLPAAPSIHSTIASTPRPASNRAVPNIYDRNLSKARASEVSASAYAFMFSEIVQYTQKRVSGINDFERRCAVV